MSVNRKNNPLDSEPYRMPKLKPAHETKYYFVLRHAENEKGRISEMLGDDPAIYGLFLLQDSNSHSISIIAHGENNGEDDGREAFLEGYLIGLRARLERDGSAFVSWCAQHSLGYIRRNCIFEPFG